MAVADTTASITARAVKGQAPSRRAATPGVLAKPVGAVFRSISRLRDARSLHPEGLAFEAEVEIAGSTRDADAPLLAEPATHAAVVRLSRGAGLPNRMPDIHGLAVRLVDAHGAGRHQDLLLATSLSGAAMHHLLVPATGFFSLPYSSILLYRIGDGLRVFEARALTEPVEGDDPFVEVLNTKARRETSFELALAPPLGAAVPIGRLTLGQQIPPSAAESLRFNPWNTGGAIRPAGPFNGLRESAYRESQRGWRD